MRWSRAHIWKWKSAFCPPAVPPFCTHWPPGGRSAPRPNGRLPSVHSSISPAIWPDSSAGASRAASYLRTRADLLCHEHDAARCAACGVRLLQDRSADSWRAELHSVLADRAFSSSLPRRRVLAIGQTKVAGWHLKPGAIALFQNDYQLPLIDPTVAAYVSAFNEHLFPILLVLGLATRFAALALLLMTAVIEIFVYPGAWPTHGVWATCFLLLLARGPGALSLDHLIARRFALAS